MPNDRLLTELQETGKTTLEYATCLAEIQEYANALGLEPTEVFITSGGGALTGVDLVVPRHLRASEPVSAVKHAFWCKSMRPGEPEICNCHWEN